MPEAYLLATKNANKSTAHGRIHHDKKATFTRLLTCDQVLVRNERTRRTRKTMLILRENYSLCNKTARRQSSI